MQLALAAALAVTADAVRAGGAIGRDSPEAGRSVENVGTTGLLAVLGGFRGLVADLLWLESNRAWERRDVGRTLALLQAVVGVEPRVDYFWLNGARIIAHDLPTWEAVPDAPAAVDERTRRHRAEQALRFLEKGAAQPGATPALWVEMGLIAQRRLGDPGRAAAFFCRAAMRPDGPEYAARLGLRLLVTAGRESEAEVWLQEWLRVRGMVADSEVHREWMAWFARLRSVPSDDRFDTPAQTRR